MGGTGVVEKAREGRDGMSDIRMSGDRCIRKI
jgi:hypothetical protein